MVLATSGGTLRLASSEGFVPDSGASAELAGVRLSSPDKVLYPEQGITKRELGEYYAAVAERMVPLVADRPLTLVRCPQGQEQKCFFQRRAGDAFPSYIRRVPVDLAGDQDDATHVAVDSLRGVIYLVQIGVLEIHTWGARRDRLDRPDRMIFDLDPGTGVPMSSLVDAALQIRSRLRELELESFVKTSGGKGLHVVVPLARRSTWDQVRAFSRALAEEMQSRDPRHFTAKAARSERAGRVYVDFLRNGAGATAVTPYSTRATPGAPVSTPLEWSELSEGVDPASFDIRTVPARLERLGRDPWESYAATEQSLSRSVRARLGLE
jgi:bifunctional non-homologous end joining protein LigD